MNFLKGIVAGAILFFAMGAAAQQAGTSANPPAMDEAMHARVKAADEQWKALLDKLQMTPDQQSMAIRILIALQDETMRVVENTGLSHDEQVAQIKSLRSMAHMHMYASLSDEQKKTMDDFMHAQHP